MPVSAHRVAAALRLSRLTLGRIRPSARYTADATPACGGGGCGSAGRGSSGQFRGQRVSASSLNATSLTRSTSVGVDRIVVTAIRAAWCGGNPYTPWRWCARPVRPPPRGSGGSTRPARRPRAGRRPPRPADRVDHVPRRQVEGVGGHGVAGRARADRGARVGQARPCRAVHPPPPISDSLAAGMIASTCSRVMSHRTTSIRTMLCAGRALGRLRGRRTEHAAQSKA